MIVLLFTNKNERKLESKVHTKNNTAHELFQMHPVISDTRPDPYENNSVDEGKRPSLKDRNLSVGAKIGKKLPKEIHHIQNSDCRC